MGRSLRARGGRSGIAVRALLRALFPTACADTLSVSIAPVPHRGTVAAGQIVGGMRVAAYSLVDSLREHALRQGDDVALVACADPVDATGDTVFTYAELDTEARRVAAGLQRELASGSRVLVRAEGAEFVRGFLGCLYAGMVAVPLPPISDNRRHRERMAAVVADTQADVVLVSAEDRQRIADRTRDTGLEAARPLALTEMELPAAEDWKDPSAGTSDIAFIQYTSGSTSRPKGVPVSHGNILGNAAHSMRMTGATRADRWGGWLPMHHDFGLVYQLLTPLVMGASTALMDASAFLRRPYSWLRLIHRCGITVSGGPNFAYDLCCRTVTDEQMAGVDLSSWSSAVNGSEPISAAVMARFAERFAPFGLRPAAMTAGYGLAEGTVCVTLSPPRVPPTVTRVDAVRLSRDEFVPVGPDAGVEARMLVGCGPAHTDEFDLRIVDPASLRVRADGEVGEIWLRGPSVVQGYWQREEESRESFDATTAEGEGGFLRTGDLGVVHEGQLYITGRIKEVLVVNGRNLYPHDIEEVARESHPALSTGVGAAFTAFSLDGAEQVVLVHEYQSTDRGETALAEAVSRIRARVAAEFAVALPGVILVRRGQVRRTSSGKIQRAGTRQAWLEGALRVLHQDLSEPLTRLLARHRTASEPGEMTRR